MNKIIMIGFLGGFSTIIYCLLYENKNKNKKKNELKFNNRVVFINRNIIDDKENIDYDRYRLILYRKPRPIYELYLKNEWEIL